MTTLTATRWSWKQDDALMTRLRAAQNSGAFDHQDIMTIVGFCTSREQMVQHVERSEAYAATKGSR